MVKRYPSDLSDAEWALLDPLIPRPEQARAPTRPRHAADPQCQLLWGPAYRLLAHVARRLPVPAAGLSHLHTALTRACSRKAGRQATPSATIIDSQSVRTSAEGVLGAKA